MLSVIPLCLWPHFHCTKCRVRNLKFAWNLKFATSKTSVNFMKKMMFLSHNWYFSVQKASIYYTFNKSHHNSFILSVFSHVANFRYVANFRFPTLYFPCTGIFFLLSTQNLTRQIFRQWRFFCLGLQASLKIRLDSSFWKNRLGLS